jgi:hypothetical protein
MFIVSEFHCTAMEFDNLLHPQSVDILNKEPLNGLCDVLRWRLVRVRGG